MTDLTGSGQPIVLGGNYRIRAPGVVGQANLVQRRSISGTTRSTTTAQERPALDRALASQEMQDVATIDVTVTRQVAPPPGALLRAPSGDDALELEVPAPGPGQDALVISVDESGAITWNFPLTPEGAIAPPTTRGAGEVLKFRVPRTPAVAPARSQGTRSIFGTVGKKILKVLVYPITDRLVGPLVDTFAGKWEAKNRPYRFRTMTPDNYASPDAPALAHGDGEWGRLASGRSLLFVHGTTSSAHSAFAGLSRADLEALSTAYGGRLFAFDHFTLSHGPPRNIEEFAKLLPPGLAFDADIVCHSRGGLVSREIVERGAAYGLAGRIGVKKVVFVGVPNAGTALAQPDHMMHMIDRMTTAIDVLPDGPATWILEGIITAVKVIGHGGLRSLEGLASMDPVGDYLQQLAAAPGRAVYRGIAADFEPKGTPFDRLALKHLVGNKVVDRIFEDAANDLVVPTDGVATAAGGGFPIPVTDMLTLGPDAGVTHTTYFSNQAVRDQLRSWLDG